MRAGASDVAKGLEVLALSCTLAPLLLVMLALLFMVFGVDIFPLVAYVVAALIFVGAVACIIEVATE
jgi:predicted membrane protein